MDTFYKMKGFLFTYFCFYFFTFNLKRLNQLISEPSNQFLFVTNYLYHFNLIFLVIEVWLNLIALSMMNISAMKPHEIQEKLGLTRMRDRNWYVQPSCATTGDGLYEGLTWLTSNHKIWEVVFSILPACNILMFSHWLTLTGNFFLVIH